MDFNLKGGGWIVEVLKVIEDSKHVKIMAYGLVAALLLYVIRWW